MFPKFILIKTEAGSVSVLIVAFCFALLTLLSAGSFVANTFVVANQLNNAADRVALAAAAQLLNNSENVCNIATEVAHLNDVELTECQATAETVTVNVTSNHSVQKFLDRWPSIGMARAGIDFGY